MPDAEGAVCRCAIDDRVRVWEFDYESDAERRAHDAVRAAAAFIRDRRESFPDGAAPTAPSDVAVLALKIYTAFLEPAKSDAETAAAIVEASRRFA